MSEHAKVWRRICAIHGWDALDWPSDHDHELTNSEKKMLSEAWELDRDRYYEEEWASEYAYYMCD